MWVGGFRVRPPPYTIFLPPLSLTPPHTKTNPQNTQTQQHDGRRGVGPGPGQHRRARRPPRRLVRTSIFYRLVCCFVDGYVCVCGGNTHTHTYIPYIPVFLRISHATSNATTTQNHQHSYALGRPSLPALTRPLRYVLAPACTHACARMHVCITYVHMNESSPPPPPSHNQLTIPTHR